MSRKPWMWLLAHVINGKQTDQNSIWRKKFNSQGNHKHSLIFYYYLKNFGHMLPNQGPNQPMLPATEGGVSWTTREVPPKSLKQHWIPKFPRTTHGW